MSAINSVRDYGNNLVVVVQPKLVVEPSHAAHTRHVSVPRLVLVVAKRLNQDGGKLVLCGMQTHIREVFDISGFLAILNVVETRAEALASL